MISSAESRHGRIGEVTVNTTSSSAELPGRQGLQSPHRDTRLLRYVPAFVRFNSPEDITVAICPSAMAQSKKRPWALRSFWDFLGPPASTMSSSKLVGFFSANSLLHSLKSKLCAHKYSRITFPNRILLLRPQMQELQVLRALRRRRYLSPLYSQTSDDYRSYYPGIPRHPCLHTHSARFTLT